MVDEKPTESKEGSGFRCPLPYVVSHIHEVSLFLDDQTNEKATSVSYFFRHIDDSLFLRLRVNVFRPSVVINGLIAKVVEIILCVIPES